MFFFRLYFDSAKFALINRKFDIGTWIRPDYIVKKEHFKDLRIAQCLNGIVKQKSDAHLIF